MLTTNTVIQALFLARLYLSVFHYFRARSMIPSSRTISSMSSNTCGFSIVGVICRSSNWNDYKQKCILKIYAKIVYSVANMGYYTRKRGAFLLAGTSHVTTDTRSSVSSIDFPGRLVKIPI